MNKTIIIILIVVVVIIGGYFLLKGSYRASAPTLGEEAEPATEEVFQAKEITVSGTEYSFSSSSITVQAGDRVKIIFRNNGRIGHNFVIRNLDTSTETIGAGQTDAIEFTAPASGTYAFFCSVPGHQAAGMKGSLIVE